MDVARKVVGTLLLAFVAVPLLVALLWAVGVTHGVLKRDFMVGVATDVIRQVPKLADEAFAAAQEPGAVRDPEERAWVDALVRTQLTPSKILAATGLLAWLEKDVGGMLEQLGAALEGDVAPDAVVLDMRPLKRALTQPVLQELVRTIVAALPACLPDQVDRWKQAAAERRIRRSAQDREVHSSSSTRTPPCNPGTGAVEMTIEAFVSAASDLPDEERPMASRDLPEGLRTARTVSFFLWFSLLIPAFLIFLGSLIAAGWNRNFLRWSGIATLAGGLLTLPFAALAGNVVPYLLRLDPSRFHWARSERFFDSEPARIFLSHLGETAGSLLTRVFSPVTTVSLVSCGIGVALLLLSFLGRPSQPPLPQSTAQPTP